MSLSDARQEHLEFISTILRKHLNPEVHKAVLFGSRATGTNKPFSDFDIGIIGPRLSSETYFDLVEAFEQSSFPFKVELVQFCDVSEEFRKEANSCTIPLL